MTHSEPNIRRRFILACLIASALVLSSPGISVAADEERVQDATVRLVIDYGDGVQKHISLPWKEKMTVAEALESAAAHPRGVKFQGRGKGETLFINSIDDCENEGSGRNWTYRVNDKPATKSCGVALVQAGDIILWKFASSR